VTSKDRTVLGDVADIVHVYTGRRRAVLDYCMITKRLVDAAKQPGFTVDSWAPLAELVDADAFVRVGNFKEVMTWHEYVGFLTNWARSAQWDCSFKRITETGDVVFLELEERSGPNSVNSMSVYEFDGHGKICRIDVYLQMALPDPDKLVGYDGVKISQ
jgi:hypothetical protein